MLYISRFVGQDHYGVVDTDDGDESIVSLSELYRLVYDVGLNILGTMPNKAKSMPESSVHVFQPLDTVTRLQTKTKVLQGVDVKTYGEMITSISWVRDDIKEPVTLRLSDFGTRCADYILDRNELSDRHVITLVLDEGISYSFCAFRRRFYRAFPNGVFGVGCVLDIRELTDQTAGQLYKSFRRASFMPICEVLDFEERRQLLGGELK